MSLYNKQLITTWNMSQIDIVMWTWWGYSDWFVLQLHDLSEFGCVGSAKSVEAQIFSRCMWKNTNQRKTIYHDAESGLCGERVDISLEIAKPDDRSIAPWSCSLFGKRKVKEGWRDGYPICALVWRITRAIANRRRSTWGRRLRENLCWRLCCYTISIFQLNY